MEKYKKKQPIKDLKEGEVILDIFVVKIKKLLTPYKNGFFFTLILSDSSGGSIEYKYWGGNDKQEVQGVYDSIHADDVILISGRAAKYNERLEISAAAENKPKVLSAEEYEADFVPEERKNIEKMYLEFESKIESISNEDLRSFVKSIFNDISIKEKFKVHPGAIQIHHGWKGGLLQHTLEILEYCEVIIKINPQLNRDLLLSTAMLHDIGKLEELEVTSRIKGSRQGQLVGHLTMGIIFLGQKLKESSLDELTKDKILHIIASHHGNWNTVHLKSPCFQKQ